jgi:hypothetical protein
MGIVEAKLLCTLVHLGYEIGQIPRKGISYDDGGIIARLEE